MDASWDNGVSHTILGSLTMTSDLVFIIIVSGAYILYYLRQESQIWCVDAYLDGGVSCTIYASL